MRGVTFITSLGLFLLSAMAWAGPIDCDLVYDEFSSLMNKNFLVEPGRYVRTLPQKLDRTEYNSEQKGRFRMDAESQGWGVAIFKTGRGTRGRFQFTWAPPRADGSTLLRIKGLTLVPNVGDGRGMRILPPLEVLPGQSVDLDTGALVSGADADLRLLALDAYEQRIEAQGSATLEFPTESLCR